MQSNIASATSQNDSRRYRRKPSGSDVLVRSSPNAQKKYVGTAEERYRLIDMGSGGKQQPNAVNGFDTDSDVVSPTSFAMPGGRYLKVSKARDDFMRSEVAENQIGN